MILTLRLLGLEVLHVELSQPEPDAEDPGYALSGGVVTSYPIQVTQRYGMEPEPWSDYEDDEMSGRKQAPRIDTVPYRGKA